MTISKFRDYRHTFIEIGANNIWEVDTPDRKKRTLIIFKEIFQIICEIYWLYDVRAVQTLAVTVKKPG